MGKPIFEEKDNIAELECLKIYDDSYDFYESVLLSFVREGGNDRDALIRFKSDASREEYRTVVHGLKSSAGSIGAKDLQKLASDIDGYCKAGDWEKVSDKHEELIGLLSEKIELVKRRMLNR